jgi:hypothetical protein
MLRVVDFVIGKLGARIGGSGVTKTARFTKVISRTQFVLLHEFDSIFWCGSS